MGPPSCMRSVVDRNVVMRRIPGTNVSNPLPCRRVMGGTRCATFARFGLQNCVSAWVRLNYVSLLRMVSRLPRRYSWPGCGFGACLSITTLATPCGDTASVEPSSFLFVLCLLKLWQNKCCVFCVYWTVHHLIS